MTLLLATADLSGRFLLGFFISVISCFIGYAMGFYAARTLYKERE